MNNKEHRNREDREDREVREVREVREDRENRENRGSLNLDDKEIGVIEVKMSHLKMIFLSHFDKMVCLCHDKLFQDLDYLLLIIFWSKDLEILFLKQEIGDE